MIVPATLDEVLAVVFAGWCGQVPPKCGDRGGGCSCERSAEDRAA